MDNIFVERLWRSLKYEEVYLHAYATVAEAKAGIGTWIGVVRLPIGGCRWPKIATLEAMQRTQYRRRHAMCEMRYREPLDAGRH